MLALASTTPLTISTPSTPKPASGVVNVDLGACRAFAANDPRYCQGCSDACDYDASVKLFQGQYEDEETGLYYNRHRYYDPDSARYLTQDPIKLHGGPNAYQYAPNPTAWIDPLGLVDLNLFNNSEAIHNSANKVTKSALCTRQLLDQ